MLGIDIEDNSRFEKKDRVNDSKFLEKIFTLSFCVKEAVIKVLSYKGIKHSKLNDIEVFHGDIGEPYVRVLSNPEIDIEISLSHDKTKSIAIAQLKND